jgi:hypothetical protein
MDEQRRAVLTGGAAAMMSVALAPGCGPAAAPAAAPAPPAAPPPAAAASSTRPAPPPGKPGDFDFLAGTWKIQHRRLAPGTTAWDEFEGEATCWTILGGAGSVEELRVPARAFSGLGLRLLDRAAGVWKDHWVNGKSGALVGEGTAGGFVDGVGVFISEDVEDGKPVLYRGQWDEIGPTRCRWSQAVSRDGGVSWDDNWVMHWRRV